MFTINNITKPTLFGFRNLYINGLIITYFWFNITIER